MPQYCLLTLSGDARIHFIEGMATLMTIYLSNQVEFVLYLIMRLLFSLVHLSRDELYTEINENTGIEFNDNTIQNDNEDKIMMTPRCKTEFPETYDIELYDLIKDNISEIHFFSYVITYLIRKLLIIGLTIEFLLNDYKRVSGAGITVTGGENNTNFKLEFDNNENKDLGYGNYCPKCNCVIPPNSESYYYVEPINAKFHRDCVDSM